MEGISGEPCVFRHELKASHLPHGSGRLGEALSSGQKVVSPLEGRQPLLLLDNQTTSLGPKQHFGSEVMSMCVPSGASAA